MGSLNLGLEDKDKQGQEFEAWEDLTCHCWLKGRGGHMERNVDGL